MKEIKIFARAGQGAITTAQLLGHAYFLKGLYPYAFPHFGAARMGAPMNAFLRVDNKPIRLRSQIYEADYLIVVDATLLRGINHLSGLKEEGVLIVNKKEGVSLPKIKSSQRIFLIPANEIALKIFGRPIGNTVLLGAYAQITKEIELNALLEAIKIRFKDKIQEINLKLAEEGFEFARGLL